MSFDNLIKICIFVVSLSNTFGNVGLADVYHSTINVTGLPFYSSTFPSLSNVSLSTDNSVFGSSQAPLLFTATIANNPMPFVSAKSLINSSNDIPALYYGRSSALLLYSFSVNGTPNTLVPLNFSSLYKLTTNSLDNNIGASTVSLALFNDSGSNLSEYSVRCQSESCYQRTSAQADNISLSLDGLLLDKLAESTIPYTYSGQFDEFFEQSILSGTMLLMLNEKGSASGSVGINAIAEAQIFTFGDISNISAFIDPFFFIDLDYLNGNPNTSLSFTSGVGNAPSSTSAVPTPDSYGLMLSGLGLFGWARYRKGVRIISNYKTTSHA